MRTSRSCPSRAPWLKLVVAAILGGAPITAAAQGAVAPVTGIAAGRIDSNAAVETARVPAPRARPPMRPIRLQGRGIAVLRDPVRPGVALLPGATPDEMVAAAPRPLATSPGELPAGAIVIRPSSVSHASAPSAPSAPAAVPVQPTVYEPVVVIHLEPRTLPAEPQVRGVPAVSNGLVQVPAREAAAPGLQRGLIGAAPLDAHSEPRSGH